MHSSICRAQRRWPRACATLLPRRLLIMAILALAACGDGVLFMGAPDSDDAALVRVDDANRALPADTFAATLLPVQQAGLAASAGSGMASLAIDRGTLAFRASAVGARVTGSAAHIHLGASNETGPIVFTLAESAAGSGIWTLAATLTSQQLASLEGGQYYIDIHSAAFPDGEIRGQLAVQLPGSGNAPTGGAVGYFNVMTGAQAIPAAATQASGIAITVFDPATSFLAEAVTAPALSGGTAHLHQGSAGFSGPALLALTETTGSGGIWAGTTTLTALQAANLSSGNFYADIHGAGFPDGALRGQIVASAPGSAPAAVPAGPAASAGSSGDTSIGTGTGSTSIGTGTGSASIDTGTGSTSIGSGTGSATIGSATGSGNIGSGTGGIGTATGSGGIATGTGSAGISTGTGAGAIGSGTGSASVGSGSGAAGLGVDTGSANGSGVPAMTTGTPF